MRAVVAITLLVSLSGCSTMSSKSKTLLLMAGSGVAGGCVGAATTPEGESSVAHGALWGGVAMSAAAVAGLLIFDDTPKRKQAEERAAQLERELRSYQDETSPERVGGSELGLSRSLPEKYRNLFTPGEWSLYRVDRWVNSSENELIHQDLILRFQQPKINPAGRAGLPRINESQGVTP